MNTNSGPAAPAASDEAAKDRNNAAHVACINATKDTLIFFLGHAQIHQVDLRDEKVGLRRMVKDIYKAYAEAHIPPTE